MPFRELIYKELYDAERTTCPLCGQPYKERVGRRWCDNTQEHPPGFLPVVEDKEHRAFSVLPAS